MSMQRRSLFTLDAATLLAGCKPADHAHHMQAVLAQMSRWNDRVQAELFSRNWLAPIFSDSMAVKDFRYNAWYGPEKAPRLDADSDRSALGGLISDKRPWTVNRLHVLPQVSKMARHVCVGGSSTIGKWTGTPLRVFLERIGADTTAGYVGFGCADGYYQSLNMATALHPQTLMAFRLADEILPTWHGFPFEVRVPIKLGFKNPKSVVALHVTNRQLSGFWTDRGYNWFSGI